MSKIYLDLDGVFADFHNKTKSLCGHDYHEDPKNLWRLVESVDNFFLSLDPLPGSQEMFRQIKEMADEKNLEIEFLTALPLLKGKLQTAPSDKRTWVFKYLCPETRVNCVTNWRHKKHYTSPESRTILIDDMSRNIVDWEQAGGIGILHVSPEDTLKRLTSILK